MRIFERFSSYSKLLRIIAYCLRFRIKNKHTGPLRAKEINEAEIRVLKTLQAIRFADEIKKLEGKTPIGKGKLANLNPFLDGDKLIRVGGRLQMSELTFTQKHPILLPPRHYLSDRIIREVHEKHHHTGIQTTLYIIRQKFWLPDGVETKYEKLYVHVCVVFVFMPEQSNTKWEIFHRFVYAKPNLLRIPVLISADHFT